MRGALLNLPAVARALRFVPVAIPMIIATTQFQVPTSLFELHHANSSAASDPLADELNRSQLIAGQAKDGAACEVSSAKNRCRFFADAPAAAARPAALVR